MYNLYSINEDHESYILTNEIDAFLLQVEANMGLIYIHTYIYIWVTNPMGNEDFVNNGRVYLKIGFPFFLAILLDNAIFSRLILYFYGILEIHRGCISSSFWINNECCNKQSYRDTYFFFFNTYSQSYSTQILLLDLKIRWIHQKILMLLSILNYQAPYKKFLI